MTQNYVCFKCGKSVEEGELFYVVELKITSGFDGVIKESADPETIRLLLDKLETESAMAVEEDVYKELKINLCKNCKDILIRFISGADLILDSTKDGLTH
jgi:hypothetical protein